MKKRQIVAGMAASSLLVIGSAFPALASTESSSLEELVKLNPGATASELKASLSEVASDEGITLNQAIDKALSESQESVAEATSPSPIDGVGTPASGSGGGTLVLGSASRKGDVFVTPASTLGYPHGHTGIYYNTTTIVEAPGTDKVSRSISASSVKVAKGAVKQYIKTTTTKRSAAADHSYKYLRGREYSSSFASNKYINTPKMNCSQLVWAAYKAASGIDLDGNGGLGVYPFNIKDSSLTITYKTL